MAPARPLSPIGVFGPTGPAAAREPGVLRHEAVAERKHAVAPGAFGRVHRPVRLVEELVAGAGIVGAGGDADAHAQGAPAQGARGLDFRADALGDRQGSGVVGVDQHEHELLAAVARREIDPPATGLDDARDARQGGIAGLVPMIVVVPLELVAVAEQQRERALAALGAHELLLEALV